MKHLIGVNKTKDLSGQRRLANNDLAVLEDHFYEGLQRQFAGYGPCVVSGCEVSGQAGAYNVAPGLVYLNSKLVYWPGAQNYDIKSNTYLVEDEPGYLFDRLFDSVSEDRPGVIEYRLKLTELSFTGDGVKMTSTGPERVYHNLLGDRIYQQQFARMSRDILPIGSIIMWAGTLDNFDNTGLGKETMTGWALCNGFNNTPDMRSRFPVGYDKDVIEYATTGGKGGVKEVTLGINHLPKHRHIPLPNSGDYGTIRRSLTGEDKTISAADTSGSGTQPDLTAAPGTDKEVGNNEAHENRPPFFVVAYLQKVNVGSISEGGGGGTGGGETGGGETGGGTGTGCNLTALQVLGAYAYNSSPTVVIYHQGAYWPFNIWTSISPKIAYVRGRNFLQWNQFIPATTLPNLNCFAPYDTAFDGREHPSAFNGAPEGWERITDEGGYVAFREITVNNPGGGGGQTGSGSGDINSTITFETEVA